MIGIVCGSELENAKGTHNKNLVRVLHHLSKTEKHFFLRAISDKKKCKLVFAPDGSDVGASAIEVSVGLRLWMRCVPDRIVHSVTLKWRVAGFAFDLLSHDVGLRAAHVDVRRSSRN